MTSTSGPAPVTSRLSRSGTSDTTAANGRRYANRYHWYVRFDGDKIAQLREYADTDHIRQTLGG